ADGVADGAGAVGPGVVVERLTDLEEDVLRRAADLLDQLGRVAVVVALEDAEDAVGGLEGAVLGRRRADERAGLAAERVRLALLGRAALLGVLVLAAPAGAGRLAGVAPLLLVVGALAGVEPGEEAGEAPLLGVLEVLADQRRGVGVVEQVVGVELL